MMIRRLRCLWCFLITLLAMQSSYAQSSKQINLADPTIFYHHKTYYLYGTNESGSNNGFIAYASQDKVHWKNEGIVLKKGEAFGSKGFWAPQVFYYHKKFFMAYVANEQIAIAESDSPLGPFTQKEKKPIAAPVKIIDPFVFFDKGKIYLYHVRLERGNRMYVAEMNDDLQSIKEATAVECLHAQEGWENTANTDWGVTEGPTVLKRNHIYYLFYSANDFRNPDYAVGYAISKSPLGPWKKFSGNPILSKKQTSINGTGHGDFFLDGKGKLNYVFHTHQSNRVVAPRRTAIIQAKFQKSTTGNFVFEMLRKSFRYLNAD
ncbi:xylan 1,4-beta-xylosidase [Pedobacter sp. UYP30]|uniref:glycoside hydrolase family 43 protein n=1 Tax=Pedobacter sp. UYP30 TaxID=1756400 RepID=UPI003392C452